MTRWVSRYSERFFKPVLQVNIIPVIGKSDSCTREELTTFRERLRTQLKDHQINIFNLDADQTIPFGVVGSNVTLEDGEGRKVRGRKYPWGTVDIEDPEHSDFLSLRRMVLSQHMLVNIISGLTPVTYFSLFVISGPQTSHQQCSLRELQATQAGFSH